MSASPLPHDAPPARFEPLTLARLDALLEVEQRAHSHPWTRGNFTDAMASGYQIQLLMGDEQILGYFGCGWKFGPAISVHGMSTRPTAFGAWANASAITPPPPPSAKMPW